MKVDREALERLQDLVDFSASALETLNDARRSSRQLDRVRWFRRDASQFPELKLPTMPLGHPPRRSEGSSTRPSKHWFQYSDLTRLARPTTYSDFPITAEWIGITVNKGKFRRFIGGDWPSSYWLRVIDLLEEAGPMLVRCGHCNALLIKRGRKEYCSKKCSQKVRSNNWYINNRELACERRREAYVKFKRKTQPKAKVGRHARRP